MRIWVFLPLVSVAAPVALLLCLAGDPGAGLLWTEARVPAGLADDAGGAVGRLGFCGQEKFPS